jgi:hypothetical protein
MCHFKKMQWKPEGNHCVVLHSLYVSTLINTIQTFSNTSQNVSVNHIRRYIVLLYEVQQTIPLNSKV